MSDQETIPQARLASDTPTGNPPSKPTSQPIQGSWTKNAREIARQLGRGLQWCFERATEIANSTKNSIGRQIAYLRCLWSHRRLAQRLHAAEIALGSCIYESGQGDPSILDKILLLDQEIEARKIDRQSLRQQLRQRAALFVRLAQASAAEPSPSTVPSPEFEATSMVRNEYCQNEIKVRELRTNLIPETRIERLRAGVGYSLITGCLILLFVTAFNKSTSRNSLSQFDNAIAIDVVQNSNRSPKNPLPTTSNLAPTPAPKRNDPWYAPTADSLKAASSNSQSVRVAPSDPNQPTEDLVKVLNAAGFDEQRAYKDMGKYRNYDLEYAVDSYVILGSAELAKDYQKGDQFDRIEIDKKAERHRGELPKRHFRLEGLKFQVTQRDDVATRGLVAELYLPIWVRGATPFSADRKSFSGSLKTMHCSEVDMWNFWFLTKEKTLRSCNFEEALIVKQNNGIIYHPEITKTTLILIIQDKIDVLKTIARRQEDYSVIADFTNIQRYRPMRWGYFRENAYIDSEWDCEALANQHDLGLDNSDQPVYFVPHVDPRASNAPYLTTATLTALQIVDKDGRVVGRYGRPR